MAIKSKTLLRPQQIVEFRDPAIGASTYLTAAAAAGATTITVNDATGLSAGKPFRIGAAEELERCSVLSVVANTITLKNPTVHAHAINTAVVEQVAYGVGETTGGVTVSKSVESTDVQSDERRLVYNTALGFATVGADTSLYGLTLYTLCRVLGIPFSKVTGSKTSSSPLHLATDFSDVGTVQNLSVALASVLQDGTIKVEELMGVDVDYTAVSVALARGNPGAVPWRVGCYGRNVEQDIAPGGAVDWTPNPTYQPSKDDIFAELTALGYWTANGTATTAAAAIAAGATTIPCTDASTIAAEDWILLDTGAALETHWVLSKATNTLTLKTPVLNGHASGCRVVKAVRNDFAAIARGSVNIAIGGSTADDFVEERQLSLGKSPAQAEGTITFALRDLTVATRARALGIPASAITNGRMVTSELLGTSPIEAIYAVGTLKSGVTNWLNLWGAAQQLAQFATNYSNPGSNAVTPFNARPSAGVQFLQYA